MLEHIVDRRFSLPADMLAHGVREDEGARISVAVRLIDTCELKTVYTERRDRCARRGITIPGLVDTVEVFRENPDTGWRVVGVFTREVVGTIFIEQPGGCARACIASAAGAINEEETPRDLSVSVRDSIHVEEP